MDLLVRQADGVERVIEDPAPSVQLNAFGSVGYELELGFSIIDPEKGTGSVISAVNTNIHALVHSGAIRLGLPPQIPHDLIHTWQECVAHIPLGGNLLRRSCRAS